eukprot:jgi/Mesvir1/16263/Mv08509-RA.1
MALAWIQPLETVMFAMARFRYAWALFIMVALYATVACGDNRLLSCVSKNDFSCVQSLANDKDIGDVNARDAHGMTALHHAAEHGYTDVAGVLLTLSASCCLQDSEGRTPLLLATTNNHVDVARILLSYGASPDHGDSRGLCSRAVAIIQGLPELENMFEVEYRQGPMGFEEQPGTWYSYRKAPKEDGEPPAKSPNDGDNMQTYFFNANTGVKQWARPPECAWEVQGGMQGGTVTYRNTVTGQTTRRLPDALAWEMVDSTKFFERGFYDKFLQVTDGKAKRKLAELTSGDGEGGKESDGSSQSDGGGDGGSGDADSPNNAPAEKLLPWWVPNKFWFNRRTRVMKQEIPCELPERYHDHPESWNADRAHLEAQERELPELP